MIPPSLPRLLNCNDEPDSVALLISYLSGQHIDIRVALDGADALNKAVSSQPDLIQLDVTMPGLGGYATCERLKSNPATAPVPVIFLSGGNSVEDRLRGFAAGVVDCILKPFSAEEVCTSLTNNRLASCAASTNPSVHRNCTRSSAARAWFATLPSLRRP